jgi:plastocyanin
VRTLVVLAALALPASAAADTTTISMPGKTFSPARVLVVPGDSVLWRNGDLVTHDVHGPDFDSGPLSSSLFYTHTFDSVGPRPFVCTVHPFMTGEVDVVAATLSGADAFAGEAVSLSGRAPAGTASVAIERAVGADWEPAGSAVPAADGTFTAVVRPDETSVYRASTALGTGASATVTVTTNVDLRVRLSGRRVSVVARPGLVATLQVYSRERFMWRDASHVKLDARGRGVLRHRGRLVSTARVVISRAAGGAALATSDSYRLRDGKRFSIPGSRY